jgi:hypothetical protein
MRLLARSGSWASTRKSLIGLPINLTFSFDGPMKIFAYLANIAFFATVLFLFFFQGRLDGKEALIFGLLFAFPVVNILALAASAKGRDFFSLFLERKRLEQEQKLHALKKSMGKEI